MNDEKRLAQYKKALISAWSYNDYNDWPIKVNSVMHLFLEEFANEFLRDMEEIQQKRLPISSVAKEFGNPARLFRIIDPVIFGMKRTRIDIERQREIVIKMLDIVKSMKYGSEYNEDGSNKLISPVEVNSIVENLNFKKTDRNSASIIQRFCGIMWAYTETIFFRAHDVTKEIHGLYPLCNGSKNLLVREYLNLKPSYIWGNTVPFIPYEKIKVYTIYKNTLKIDIDSYNHLFLHEGNYIDDLIEYVIEADGKIIEIDELLKIMLAIPKTIETIHTWVNNSDWRTIVNRYADIYWYRKSPLRNLLKKDWRVTESVRENVRTGSINKKRLENLSKESIDRLIRIVI